MSKTGDAGMRFEMALSFLEDGDVTQALKWLDKAFESAEATDIASFTEQIAAKPNLDSQFTNRFAENMDSSRLAVAREALDEEKPDYASVESLVKELAEKGNAEAQYLLATVYRLADDPLHDTAKYVEWIQKAAAGGWEAAKEQMAEETSQTDKWAEQGNAMGMCMAAAEYRDGKTLSGLPHEKDILKAIELFEKAFAAGAKEGAKELAKMYEEGIGVSSDPAKAHEWTLKAAELGDVVSQVSAGLNFLRGNGVAKDAITAVKWFKKAAEQGSRVGMSFVGDSFKYGWGVNVDTAQAAAWYEKAIAPEAENSFEEDDDEIEPSYEAMMELAELLLDGNGVEKDVDSAVNLIKESAEGGVAKAQFMYGSILVRPEALGVEDVAQDVSSGVEWIKKAAEQSFGMSECTLAAFYIQGIGVEKNLVKAKELYERAIEHGGLLREMEDDAKTVLEKLKGMDVSDAGTAEFEDGATEEEKEHFQATLTKAESGDVASMMSLYEMYWGRKGVKVNKSKALVWCKRAAENGSVDGMKELGDCYRDGVGCDVNAELAVSWYEKAAADDNSIAMWRLARLYEDGELVDKDIEKAIKYYKMNAEKHDDSVSAYKVGMAYYFGKGVSEDEQEAFKWFEKAAAQGHADAQCRYAECYMMGNGVEKDLVKAREWYTKSAAQGVDLAQFNLGKIYYFGRGVEKDFNEAYKWLLKSAEQGRDKAQTFVGTCCRRGLGVDKDLASALGWYRKAAEQDEVEAEFWMGKFYAEGWGGVDKDMTIAREWYEKSAKLGDVDAICALGWIYQLGEGVDVDCATAIEWFRKGSEKGDGVCTNNWARLVEDGKGTEQDYEKALSLFQKSSEQGCSRANYHLGRFYENGLGVEIDIEKAKEFYAKVADKNKDAKAALERLS